ncbi:MAG: alginate O-acetyltransferase [Verrucomicrobiae bacterium]|nr:alginate O-acetyltransferase [Verrucomicrobiae bacterium]
MAIIWLPTLGTFFHLDAAPAFNEKRQMARFPQRKPGLAGLKNYFAGLESYFNDHFGYRTRLIHWHNNWKYLLFRDKIGSDVIVGRDDWLFYTADGMVDHYRGVRQFTTQDLLDWETLLEQRRDWLARRGIQYIFIVAPDKQTIYSETLPAWMTKVRPNTKLDQFFAWMRAHSTVDVLDLRPALRDARRIAPTYYKTDTHWNLFGGFIACQEIIKNLSKQQPALEPLSLDSFEQENRPASGGDLVDLLGLDINEITEDNNILLTPKAILPALEMSATLTKNPKAAGIAVVFHDSFGTAMKPFLGYAFGKVIYLGQHELDPASIQREQPSIVISEIVEREFNSDKPNEKF